MTSTSQLLRLYPRAWRERYGDEFVAMLGDEPLQVQQIVDIVSGAIDAWLSADVRRATTAATGSSAGGIMQTIAICERNQRRYTKRDGLIGAAIMLVGTLILSLAGLAALRAGWGWTGHALVNTSYLVAMMLSMPFWLTKGQPWKAQAVIIGVTIACLMVIMFLGPSN